MILEHQACNPHLSVMNVPRCREDYPIWVELGSSQMNLEGVCQKISVITANNALEPRNGAGKRPTTQLELTH